MSKLKFQVALPTIQLLLASTLLIAGRYASPPRAVDFPRFPTAILICKAINAPATVFSVILTSWLWSGRVDQPPTKVSGLYIEDVIFLAAVIVLWYFVGRAIDFQLRTRTPIKEKTWARVLINSALMLFGLVLLLVGIEPLFGRGGFSKFGEDTILGTLYLLWFGVFFFVPVRSLLNILKSRRLARVRSLDI